MRLYKIALQIDHAFFERTSAKGVFYLFYMPHTLTSSYSKRNDQRVTAFFIFCDPRDGCAIHRSTLQVLVRLNGMSPAQGQAKTCVFLPRCIQDHPGTMAIHSNRPNSLETTSQDMAKPKRAFCCSGGDHWWSTWLDALSRLCAGLEGLTMLTESVGRRDHVQHNRSFPAEGP